MKHGGADAVFEMKHGGGAKALSSVASFKYCSSVMALL